MKDIHATSSPVRRMSLPNNPMHELQPYRFIQVIFAALILLGTLGGCNSGDDQISTNSGPSSESPSELLDQIEGKSLITQTDRHYSVEDFLAIGWKKSKQLEVETLPESVDAWYGFYMQKDIELRFYDSHEAALTHGVPPAQETIKKDAGVRIGAATVWTVNIALYGAYAVAGNVVMMCELELASCEALINAMVTTESNTS